MSFCLLSLNFLYILCPLILLIGLIFINKKNNWHTLSTDYLYKPTRLFFCSIILLASIYNCFTPYNYYFNEYYIFDRLILLILGISFIWLPWLIPILILTCILWIRQQFVPLGYCSVLDKRLFYEIPLIFLAYLCVPKKISISLKYVWIVVFSLFASNYFVSGLGKLQIGPELHSWITDNNLFVHFIFSHQFGWLNFMNNKNIELITLFLSKYEVILCFFTVITELGAVLIGAFFKTAVLILSLLLIFHLGVFIESGIFFWKWVYVILLFLMVLFKYKSEFKFHFFSYFTFTAIAMFCIISKKVFNPVELSWWDAKYNVRFEYFVNTSLENTRQISGHFFAPYEQYFTFQRLYGLVPNEIMLPAIPFSDYLKYKELQCITPDKCRNWRNNNKQPTYDAKEVEVLREFIITYFRNYNQHKSKNLLSKIPWAPHLWKDKFAFKKCPYIENVKEFSVVFVEESISGLKANETFRKVVFAQPIPTD